MKKLMTLVLSFGLVLLGTAPVMAAEGEVGVNTTLPLLQSDTLPAVVGVDELSDTELAQVNGENLPALAWSAAKGAATEVVIYVVKKKYKGEKIKPNELAAKALYGASMGTVRQTLALAKATIDYGGKVARYAHKTLTAAFAAAQAGLRNLWDRNSR